MKLPEQLIQWIKHRQSTLCHRQLLVINGQEQWATNVAKTLLNSTKIQSVLWVGNGQVDVEKINVKDYRAKLGHEYDWVILNCFSGFRANATMGLSGTIKANGLMVIVCPELSQWPKYEDPEQHNRISFGYSHKNPPSLFVQHLIRSFKEDKSVAILSAETFTGEVFLKENNPSSAPYNEQQDAIKSICKVALGHRNRPLVLTADRGRGKSSALGIAAAELMLESSKTIVITAPHIKNVEQVFTHNKRLLPHAVVLQNSVTLGSSLLTFKPVDKLLENDASIDLLMVDEASAIPVHMLMKLVKRFSRVVFSSTVHGYEGSGRGFEMRFIKQLTLLKPNYKRLHISQPIRWYKNDSLEQFWFNTLFHTEQKKLNTVESLNQPIRFHHISKADLLNDKNLLASVFRLLIDAHYQTSQDDFQRLLDAPEVECFLTTQGNTLLGVAQIVREGGDCFAELADKVAGCSRRVKGHLVVQNITSTYNLPAFLLAKQWRISRIAISPEHQRKTLGIQLLEFIEQHAKQQQVQFLTTSFGCNTDILNFWHKSQFNLIKLSAKPEVSSGEHSGICIKPLTQQAKGISEDIFPEFYRELLFQMDKNYQDIPPTLLLVILLYSPVVDKKTFASQAIIKQFASGERPYANCKRLLNAYLIKELTCCAKLTTQQQAILVAAILQNKTDKQLCEEFSLKGKKHIELSLKTSFEKILDNN